MRTTINYSAWVTRAAIIGSLAAGLWLSAIPAGAAVPAGMRQTGSAAGGYVLSGPAPEATSAAGALRAGISDVRRAFGAAPAVLGATRSTDGTVTVALFRTQSGARLLGGLILATFAPAGGSRIAIVYDRIDRIATTAPALIARATAGGSSAAPIAAPGPLRLLTAPDGSVRALVPPAWKTPIFRGGEFSATGPDGAEVDQEVSARLIDPRSPGFRQALALQRQMNQPANPFATPFGIPLTFEPDPAQAFSAFARTIAQAQHMADPAITIERTIPQAPQGNMRVTEIIGTDSVRGTRMRFDGIIGVAPPNGNGAWVLSVKMISAPVDAFAHDLPTLAAIYNSYRVDQGVMGQQVQQTIADDRAGAARGLALMQQTQATNAATFNASMSHAQEVQSGIDRSTAGFTHYLNGTTVIEHSATGARTTAGDGFAAAIVNNDPQNFRIVPESEYRRGTDF